MLLRGKMRAKLQEDLRCSATKVVDYFESKLRKNASLGDEATDIACYFKVPMMFVIAGKMDLASQILMFIKETFMTESGDFFTKQSLKSANPAYIEFWSYTNGWIIRAAQQLSRSDMTEPGSAYLEKYHVGDGLGYLTHNVTLKDGVTDVLTAAHHGLIHLEAGRLDLAIASGNYLTVAFQKQPHLENGFYLRLDASLNPITDYSSELSAIHFIDKEKPEQLYFMIAYPAAYLALLYKETKNKDFLNEAKRYLDFALSCSESVYHSKFSHKLAWAASIVYAITNEENYLDAVVKIVRFFMGMQSEDGMWFSDSDCVTSYDQSAEIACWFLEINNNLKALSSLSQPV